MDFFRYWFRHYRNPTTRNQQRQLNDLRTEQLKALVKKGKILPTAEYDPEAVKEKIVMLLHGKATAKSDKKEISGPVLLEAQAYEFDKDVSLFVC